MQKSLLQHFLRTLGLPTGGVATTVTASRTLTKSDNGAVLNSTSGTAVTLTLAQNLPAGFGVTIIQSGAGAVTVAAASGVTVANVSSFVKTSGANSTIKIVQKSANAYVLTGEGAVA